MQRMCGESQFCRACEVWGRACAVHRGCLWLTACASRETYHLPKLEADSPAEPKARARKPTNTGPPPDFDVDSILEKMREEQRQKDDLLAKLRVRADHGITLRALCCS